MKLWTPSLVLGVAVSIMFATAAHARVVLIGVDGASWNVMDPLLERGELPNLAALIKRGVHADLETVEPVISPTVWTSIATGRTPDAHGVSSFWSARRQVPNLFERLAARGRRVGVYDYLVTWPPSELPGGFVIPGWLRRDDRVTPANVWTRAGVPAFVIDYDTPRTNMDYLVQSRTEVTIKASRWNALAKAFDLEVGAVTFYTPDTRSHRFWQAGFPEDFDEPGPQVADEIRDAIADGYRGVDRSIGEIVATLSPEDSVIVASDHGFQAGDQAGNVWITRNELFDLVGLRDAPGLRVAGTFGAVAIEITLAEDAGGFAQRDRVHTAAQELLESCRSTEGEPLFDVYRLDIAPRPAGFERGLGDLAYQWVIGVVLSYGFGIELPPDIHGVVIARPRDASVATLWPHAEVDVLDRKLPIREVFDRQEFTGTHHPTAILIAAGGPIVHAPARTNASVLDLAPLVFWLAGEVIPDDLDGQVHEAWLDASVLAKRPVERRSAAEFPELARPSVEADSPEKRKDLEEKLRGLGYIE